MVVRIFGLSVVVTIVSLIIAFLYGGVEALILTAILGVFEISLSFDNAVINATILRRMSEFWQKIFLTIGILIAVFGMRLVFPLVIVWLASGLNPVEALDLALNPPPNDAAYFPNGDPSYETIITDAHPQIAAFGGMFLLMLFLDFVFEKRDLQWLRPIERPLAKIGKLDQLSVVVALLVLAVVSQTLAKEPGTVLFSGILGLMTYLLVGGLGDLFESQGEDDDDAAAGDDDAERSVATKAGDTAAQAPASKGVGTTAGKAAFFLFMYLEVLDASFSFDGVIGAFAISQDIFIIALGLGVGAMWIRSLTVYLVRQGTLDDYAYLEHGAMWAIGALAAILLISIKHEVPEVVTGLIGVGFIGAAYLSSLVRNKRIEAAGGQVEHLGG